MRYLQWMLFILSCLTCSVNALESESGSRYETWIAPPPDQQLYKEGLDDQKGMGRIFVPAITNTANEPYYAVFQEDELIGERNMGSSFFLLPGRYTVLLGTGSLDQRIRKEIDIRRGESVIIEPDWCALTVEVIDESRNYHTQDLQIFKTETLENFGIIPAIDPELGEQLQTLILSPGLYKIVERGRDINTFINFSTVLLEPGTYTPYTIVIDSQSRHFIGSGILTAATHLRQSRHWKLFGAVHGSVILNTANDVTSRKTKTNVSLLSQLENRILLDLPPHYYLSNNYVELGALRQQGESFQISQDRIQLKNTYVYYLLPWIGGYTRFEVTTHLFNTYIKFSDPKDIVLRNRQGELLPKFGVDQIRLEPSFYPLGLKEGLGVNITPIRTYIARLSLRTGFGIRQTYNNNVYQQSAETDTLFTQIPDSHLRGLEVSLISNLSLLRNLVVTTELDILFPTSLKQDPVIDLENTASLIVTRNVTLEYILRLNRDPAFDWTIQEQFVSVRISYFIL